MRRQVPGTVKPEERRHPSLVRAGSAHGVRLRARKARRQAGRSAGFPGPQRRGTGGTLIADARQGPATPERGSAAPAEKASRKKLIATVVQYRGKGSSVCLASGRDGMHSFICELRIVLRRAIELRRTIKHAGHAE